MNDHTQRIAELKRLQEQIDSIRNELGISRPDEVIYLEHYDRETVVVTSDGFGHATLSVVEGNYPADYCTKWEKTFDTEQEAQLAADTML